MPDPANPAVDQTSAAAPAPAAVVDDPKAAAPAADPKAAAPAPDPAAAAPGASAAAPADPAAAPAELAAPEKYEFAPIEGVVLDSEVAAGFGEVAKELKLSQEAASKIVGKVAPLIAARQNAKFEADKAGWETEIKADAELGGEKLDETLAVAKRGIDAYAGPKFYDFLRSTGLGSHPELIRAFHKIGLTVKEDTVLTGRQASGAPADARSLYPKSQMNA